MSVEAAPTGTLTYLLTQGLTIAHLAHTLGCDHEVVRAIIADPDTPMNQQTRSVLTHLTARKVADACALISGDELRTHLTRLTLDGCQFEDIARTVNLPVAKLRAHIPMWVDTSTPLGSTWSLTIDDIDDPHVPAALTVGRLESLETMGWGREDVEATVGPGLPTDPKSLTPRTFALAVTSYWQAYSGRLNPHGTELALQARDQGVRTPADWDPPTQALWWPPADIRHLLGEDLDFSCGPTPRRK